MFKKFLSLFVITCFLFSNLGPLPKAHAQNVERPFMASLPEPGTMVNLSPAYQPALIKGLTVNKDNPFLFDFIMDTGHSGLKGDALKKEGDRLVKYFFACLTIPDKDLWVNLSPYEKDRMVPQALGQTALGRDLLAEDYILKQLTASLIYPEKNLGREFWDRVYSKATLMYGTTQIPVNTFNKVWILADKATVYEHNQTGFVLDGHLKVMLEEDYLALQKHKGSVILSEAKNLNKPLDSSVASLPQNDAHRIASQIIRQIVLPELEHEVNTGKNFATLRQIFNSLILASWYKKNLKEALLNQVYADKNTVKGIQRPDVNLREAKDFNKLKDSSAAPQNDVDIIYQQYIKAYKKGVFNYIKEDPQSDGQTIPRKYFSGGFAKNDAMLSIINSAMSGSSDRVFRAFIGLVSAVNLTVLVGCKLNSPASPVLQIKSRFTRAMISRGFGEFEGSLAQVVKGWKRNWNDSKVTSAYVEFLIQFFKIRGYSREEIEYAVKKFSKYDREVSKKFPRNSVRILSISQKLPGWTFQRFPLIIYSSSSGWRLAFDPINGRELDSLVVPFLFSAIDYNITAFNNAKRKEAAMNVSDELVRVDGDKVFLQGESQPFAKSTVEEELTGMLKQVQEEKIVIASNPGPFLDLSGHGDIGRHIFPIITKLNPVLKRSTNVWPPDSFTGGKNENEGILVDGILSQRKIQIAEVLISILIKLAGNTGHISSKLEAVRNSEGGTFLINTVADLRTVLRQVEEIGSLPYMNKREIMSVGHALILAEDEEKPFNFKRGRKLLLTEDGRFETVDITPVWNAGKERTNESHGQYSLAGGILENGIVLVTPDQLKGRLPIAGIKFFKGQLVLILTHEAYDALPVEIRKRGKIAGISIEREIESMLSVQEALAKSSPRATRSSFAMSNKPLSEMGKFFDSFDLPQESSKSTKRASASAERMLLGKDEIVDVQGRDYEVALENEGLRLNGKIIKFAIGEITGAIRSGNVFLLEKEYNGLLNMKEPVGRFQIVVLLRSGKFKVVPILSVKSALNYRKRKVLQFERLFRPYIASDDVITGLVSASPDGRNFVLRGKPDVIFEKESIEQDVTVNAPRLSKMFSNGAMVARMDSGKAEIVRFPGKKFKVVFKLHGGLMLNGQLKKFPIGEITDVVRVGNVFLLGKNYNFALDSKSNTGRFQMVVLTPDGEFKQISRSRIIEILGKEKGLVFDGLFPQAYEDDTIIEGLNSISIADDNILLRGKLDRVLAVEKKLVDVPVTAQELSRMPSNDAMSSEVLQRVNRAKNMNPAMDSFVRGGIDLTHAISGITVIRDANGGVKYDIDPAMIVRFKKYGVLSADPMIIRVSPMSTAEITPLLGFNFNERESIHHV